MIGPLPAVERVTGRHPGGVMFLSIAAPRARGNYRRTSDSVGRRPRVGGDVAALRLKGRVSKAGAD